MQKAAKQIVARYSAPKVVCWSVAVGFLSTALLADAVARGWHFLDGPYSWIRAIGIGAAPFALGFSVVLIVNFFLVGGVAIARINDEFVLYYPLSRKRVPLRPDLTITATWHVADAPNYTGSPIKPKPVFAPQVTLRRPGQKDVNFRTGLLRETAADIARRMSELVK